MAPLAAVTGASGMVGKRIVALLLKKGYRVRILTRNASFNCNDVELIIGDLTDQNSLNKLTSSAEALFHCAAELIDESKMESTNILGTKLLIESAQKNQVNYICHMSSVGVIGKINGSFADESTPCAPMNLYEKTKLESERIVRNYTGNASVVILRPTNVIDKNRNAILNQNSLKVFLKGGENAHIVHAEDVAAAALYFLDHALTRSPDCFIVSCDEEKLNTLAGCIAICKAIKNGEQLKNIKPLPHLSWRIPYFIRIIKNGTANRSDVRYSSQKLLSSGFRFSYGFLGALKEICENS